MAEVRGLAGVRRLIGDILDSAAEYAPGYGVQPVMPDPTATPRPMTRGSAEYQQQLQELRDYNPNAPKRRER